MYDVDGPGGHHAPDKPVDQCSPATMVRLLPILAMVHLLPILALLGPLGLVAGDIAFPLTVRLLCLWGLCWLFIFSLT